MRKVGPGTLVAIVWLTGLLMLIGAWILFMLISGPHGAPGFLVLMTLLVVGGLTALMLFGLEFYRRRYGRRRAGVESPADRNVGYCSQPGNPAIVPR
jgi:formate hydrogenlyase subunit 3/multisubunit Na+/H+ antiporter MnhD subunit